MAKTPNFKGIIPLSRLSLLFWPANGTLLKSALKMLVLVQGSARDNWDSGIELVVMGDCTIPLAIPLRNEGLCYVSLNLDREQYDANIACKTATDMAFEAPLGR